MIHSLPPQRERLQLEKKKKEKQDYSVLVSCISRRKQGDSYFRSDYELNKNSDRSRRARMSQDDDVTEWNKFASTCQLFGISTLIYL